MCMQLSVHSGLGAGSAAAEVKCWEVIQYITRGAELHMVHQYTSSTLDVHWH
jgi:hypothetical protein